MKKYNYNGHDVPGMYLDKYQYEGEKKLKVPEITDIDLSPVKPNNPYAPTVSNALMDSINNAGHLLSQDDPLLKRLRDLDESIIKKRGGAAGSNRIL